MATITITADVAADTVAVTMVGRTIAVTLYSATTWEIAEDGSISVVCVDAPRKTVNRNTYAHFTGPVPVEGPTEQQRATLAARFLRKSSALPAALGAPVCAWAFSGLTPDLVSERYGDGSKVFLA